MKHSSAIKVVFLALLCVATLGAVHAASFVKGCIYLKNGSVIECGKNDRIKLPKRFGSVKLFREAYRKEQTKEIYRLNDIDSIVCWHATTPEHRRKFTPSAEAGWLWIYFETPYICVGVYSKKGYGIDNNGGIQIWHRQGMLSQSRTAYYLRKHGEQTFQSVGSASRNAKNTFRERIADYIQDDPELSSHIRQTHTNRNKTILMLRDYVPTHPDH